MIPPTGHGERLGEIHSCLNNLEAGKMGQGWDHAPSPALHGSATAYHFKRLEDLEAFLVAFPDLVLVGGQD